jgi:hypothetical protein
MRISHTKMHAIILLMKQHMHRLTPVFLWIFLSAAATPGISQTADQAVVLDKANQSEARRFFDLAIAAKGGREKLRAVSSLMMTSDGVGRWSMFKKFPIHIVDVYSLPWKKWTWNDHGDSIFGLSERMYNFENGQKYFLDPNQPELIGNAYPRSDNGQIVTIGKLTDFEPPDLPLKGKKMDGLATYLLILSWIEPDVLGMYREDGHYVIHTKLGENAIDIVLDRKTYLPREWRSGMGKPLRGVWLRKYQEFDGIMMPTESGEIGQDAKWKHRYEFNPAIDNSIWLSPPPRTLGENGWRRRQ